jgi:hypothetical protein
MTTHDEEPYCVLIGPHDRADGKIVYALACPHMTASTIDVEHRFSPDFGLALFWLVRAQFGFTADEAAHAAMRMLLGFVLEERSDCGCHRRPFGVELSEAGTRIVDLG